jgi:diguanylate cyclase (GGDEF)-like protein
MPLIAQSETLGVLHLQGAIAALAYGDGAGQSEQESKLRLIDAAATTIALAVSNLRQKEDLRQQSLHDPLTGLYNRRFLQDALDREAARARRSGAPLGVLMLDIDYFKQVNDNHGHVAGDLVLKWLGRFLRDGVRGGDMACRYGGEEFILLVPGATLEHAAQRAEQIRAGVESGSAMEFDGLALGPITVSLGVATFCADADAQVNVADIVRAADEALLRAKKSGRNRIVLAAAASAIARDAGTHAISDQNNAAPSNANRPKAND